MPVSLLEPFCGCQAPGGGLLECHVPKGNSTTQAARPQTLAQLDGWLAIVLRTSPRSAPVLRPALVIFWVFSSSHLRCLHQTLGWRGATT